MLVVRRCKNSLVLHGTVECYYVFDKTSYRTGLNTIKNTAPYPGLSLNFCAIQLDGGPVKTSTICFDNSGIDPNHPYVIAKARTPFSLRYFSCQSTSRQLFAALSALGNSL
jgi:hypothetical protein